jgi:hypothetical protein
MAAQRGGDLPQLLVEKRLHLLARRIVGGRARGEAGNEHRAEQRGEQLPPQRH